MKTREEKLKAINKEIANKVEYCRSCKLLQPNPYWECWCSYYWDECKTLWQAPVMIWDVLGYKYRYINLPKSKENSWHYEFDWEVEDMVLLIDLWEEKRLPIEEQSEECIDYIFNLLPKD